MTIHGTGTTTIPLKEHNRHQAHLEPEYYIILQYETLETNYHNGKEGAGWL
jgi:hypothetical protein